MATNIINKRIVAKERKKSFSNINTNKDSNSNTNIVCHHSEHQSVCDNKTNCV